jgi:hypothetical protein
MPLPAGIEQLTPKIPLAGLVEATRSWSSAGELFAALAAVDEPEREWTARDIERRVHRVLAQRLESHLTAWPIRADAWLDALPAESLRPREVALAPNSGTSWRETAKKGWPPAAFHGKRRHRIADTLLVSTLRWTLEVLTPVVRDAELVVPGLLAEVAPQVQCALGLLETEPVSRAHAIAPSFQDLSAVSGEGRPWNVLSPVTEALLWSRSAGLLELIDALVVPDDQLTGRLFQLGALGELLVALRACGAETTPIRPVSGAASHGPAYRVTMPSGEIWDLWFEAAGVWGERGIESPYRRVSTEVAGAGGTLGADLLLCHASERAFLIECKYSAEPSRVARDGFHQAAAYALEACEIFDTVISVVVGPSDVVGISNLISTDTAELGIFCAEDLGELMPAIGLA